MKEGQEKSRMERKRDTTNTCENMELRKETWK